MADDREETGELILQGTGIRAALQAVEDALVDSGYTTFLVATTEGSFEWTKATEAPLNCEG